MYERIEESGTDRSRTEEYGMRTLLDYIGLNPLRPLVAFGGDESGGNGGDSRPEEAKALDETDVSVGYGSGQVDPGLASAVGLSPVGGYSGITGPSAYEISEALGGGDRDPTPTPVPVVSAVEPAQTTLEGLAQEQYLSYDPATVNDFMVDMDPFDVETVQQLADQYYDGGSDPLRLIYLLQIHLLALALRRRFLLPVALVRVRRLILIG
jgi:hypothetical protein